MVKLKILKNVGQFTVGQIVEVDDDLAEQLLIVNHTSDGLVKTEHRRAMLLEEAEKIEAQMKDPKNLTLGEATALGIRNIVETPKDPELDEMLAARAEFKAPEPKKKGGRKAAQQEV